MEFRKNFKDQDLDDFITKREDKFDNIEISQYKLENTDSYEGNVEESFNFYEEDGADIINDKIYIQPCMFLKIKENPFKLEKRLSLNATELISLKNAGFSFTDKVL